MKKAEEILKEYSISYGGIRYTDFDNALKAMKIYAEQVGFQALQNAADRQSHNEVKYRIISTPFKLP